MIEAAAATTGDGGAIRRASLEDHAWITRQAALAFVDLGDYGTVMPQWLAQPGVVSWVAAVAPPTGAEVRRGFAMLGFYVDRPGARPVADLLAIGVCPEHRRGGVGRALLHHVIAVAAAVAPAHGCDDLRLTVAHTNAFAQAWYVRAGFVVVPGDHGTYANGQRAIRMARPLAP